MQPLAFMMRPQTIDDIVGQDHLIGPNGPIRKMIENQKLSSMILYGNPGIGKTTISNCICEAFNQPFFKYNASTDNKQQLKEIIDYSINYDINLIIDEIHRMKKDIQDYLLPYVEEGKVRIIGLTTINPYHSVNPAIRSRTVIYKLNDITIKDITIVINRALEKHYPERNLNESIIQYIAQMANNDLRSALNMLEVVMNTTLEDENITLEDVSNIIQRPAVSIDKDTDLYYDTLSGLQKSIRGSDVDASLHYLALLLSADDLLPLIRRLWVIAYEDIGLANPNIGPRAKAATDIVLQLGMPEARIPLATLVVDMALSPKSNTAYTALDKALKNIESGKSGTLPLHLKNTYSFDKNQTPYKYPHDYPGGWVNQQYLPNELLDVSYYNPKDTSQYERALKMRYEAILKAKNK